MSTYQELGILPPTVAARKPSKSYTPAAAAPAAPVILRKARERAEEHVHRSGSLRRKRSVSRPRRTKPLTTKHYNDPEKDKVDGDDAADAAAVDLVRNAIATYNLDELRKWIRASHSITVRHLCQLMLQATANVQEPTLDAKTQRIAVTMAAELVPRVSTPQRGLWTIIRYYRRFDQLALLNKLVTLLREHAKTDADAAAWLQYTPRKGLPTTRAIAEHAFVNREPARKLARHILTTFGVTALPQAIPPGKYDSDAEEDDKDE